jgi:flagellin
MIINTQTAAFTPSSAIERQNKTAATTDASGTTQTDSVDENLTVAQNNLTAALSPLRDGDAATATLASLRQSLLGQPGLAMMAQAQSLRKSALQLLQQ